MKHTLTAAYLAVLTTACDQLVTKPLAYTSVEVRTERRDGRPIGGVPLILYTGQRPMGYDTSNAAGQARFDFVPTGGVLLYGVLAEAPAGYEFPEKLLGGPPSNTVPGLTLGRDSVPVVRFTFLRVGHGTITARVVDAAGAGFANADVELYVPTGVMRRSKTGTDGNVTFEEVPFGMYGVSVPRPPEYRDVDEAPAMLKDGLLIEDGVTATAGTFSLLRCQGTIDLSVTDITRGSVPGLRAYLYTPSGAIDSALTTADGKARFVTPLCGSYGVRIVGSYEWRVTAGRGTEFEDGIIIRRGTTKNFSFSVNTCRGAVRVSVVDPAGSPVPNATLTLYTAASLEPNVVKVATTGTWTFDNVRCWPPDRGVDIVPPAGWTLGPGQTHYYADGLVVKSNTTLDVKFTLARISP